MTTKIVEQRLRGFLLWLAGAMCAGTLVELWLQDHYEEPLQLLPIVLCGLGGLAVLAVIARPHRMTVWALRGVMVIVGPSSLFGVYEHLVSNWEIVRETKPTLELWATAWQAAHGAAPLLAPGILALAASVALAATYYHPILGSRED